MLWFPDRVRLFAESKGQWILLALLIGMAICYDYPETLLKRPQSIHNWRQSDGASLALNYSQEGMQFFKPRTHGLYSDGYTTGYTAPSEIPILYYFVAILYKLFGYHEYLFRATNLLLFFLGLFYLFRLSRTILNNTFYPVAVVVLLFSSPLLVYYANNFMPNTVGLSFTMIGWYYFYRYSANHKTRTYLTAVLFFFLAASMKITELAGPLILLALMLMDRFRIMRLNLGTEKHLGGKIAALLAVFLVVAGWVFYAKWYNNLHGTSQFSTFTFPIWNMKPEDIDFVLHKMKVIWLPEYYLPFTLYALVFCSLVCAVFHKHVDKILGMASIFLLIGLVAYSILWFEALGDHDYFFIGFYILPAFVFINFFQVVLSFNMKIIYKRIISIAVLGFMFVNVNHAAHRHHIRYFSWMNDYPEMQDLYQINPYLQQKGITGKDTIVFFSSPNIRPLYLMNLKGWTLWDYADVTDELRAEDSVMMADCIRKGAAWFIVNNTKSLMKRESLLPYTRDLYGKFGNVMIFRIPPVDDNFNLTDSISN
ncbi:MAG: glycosyltransferase family 39 protein [Bacteroidales bacterium]|nr:glycosyltransferase family 39 protein [Bacteroidales bacterium]